MYGIKAGWFYQSRPLAGQRIGLVRAKKYKKIFQREPILSSAGQNFGLQFFAGVENLTPGDLV